MTDAIQDLINDAEECVCHEPTIQRAQAHTANRDTVAALKSSLEGRAAEVAQLRKRAERAEALLRGIQSRGVECPDCNESGVGPTMLDADGNGFVGDCPTCDGGGRVTAEYMRLRSKTEAQAESKKAERERDEARAELAAERAKRVGSQWVDLSRVSAWLLEKCGGAR